MIVTFDNKLLLFKAATRQIDFQQIIEDVKVVPNPSAGKLQLKNKKSKDKFVISFDREEKEDEFFLHLEKMKMQK